MIASVLHRAAGLTIAADRALPGFVPLADSPSGGSVHGPANDKDVRMHLETRPHWHGVPVVLVHRASNLDTSGQPVVTVSRSAEGFHFSYADGTRVWIDGRGTDVWCTWPSTASLEDTCTYLCGPILGLVLRLRGSLAFHASAVQFGAAAIGFVGPHGAGKSTLAAALAARGCAIVTDDVLHVRREGSAWLAEPFASMLKLWPDGAELALQRSDLPRIAAGWDKRALVPDDRIPAVDDALPLAALFCFAEPDARPGIEPIPAASALVRLAADTSAAHLLDREMRAAEFQALAALVRDIPCWSLTPPDSPRDHPRFVDQILVWGRDCGHAAG